MPTCPHCGDEFRAGGTYTSHVRHCDADPNEPTDELNSEVERLRERVNRLEEQVASGPSPSEFETIWTALMDPNGRVPSNSRLKDYEEGLEQLSELKKKVEKFTDDCPNCGATIPVPHSPGRHDCPSCGGALNWEADDIPTFGGQRGGETVRTTR